MFYVCEDSEIENCADDTTPFACASDINTVISELQITSNKLFTWFNNNHMKVIPHFWKKSTSFEFKNSEKSLFWWNLVDSNSIEKLLGIQIDSGFTFDEHIFSICNKIGKKINVLSILVNYMPFDKTLEFSHWHLHVFT